MTWLKDILIKLLDIISSLPIKIKCVYIGVILIAGIGYLFYQEHHSYELETLRITGQHIAQPSNSDNKDITFVGRAGRIDKPVEKIDARGVK